MLAPQRQERILTEVRARGAVRVTDLVAELAVSDMTVRRDIAQLADRGLVRRVHGGAVSPQHTAHEPQFATKRGLAAAQKLAIARAALAYVTPGGSIALSAGTTTHALAELIAASPHLRPLTVVTNSVPVSDALHAAGRATTAGDPHDLDVVLTGGTRTPSDALVGPVADAALGQLRVDRLFLGVHGLGPSGLTTPNLLEAQTDRALVASADEVLVLADRSKWAAVGLARICGLDAVDVLLTDDLPDDVRAATTAAVGRVEVVAGPGHDAAEPATPPTA
ncbi:DeoR/GlpR family DNA-binding transcription regulator [uncultured Cellulomonas sp.]|uniref:DeoR/GlpR family DNA-binding transcription regulator n=1 Tax=uncultured Cellulomonas sp. TaxID=189682 RepID=UPI0026095820|nr:DeoR/GlpR family DNA-binding transcription regulator [uncultured Cellulomonas sp.]